MKIHPIAFAACAFIIGSVVLVCLIIFLQRSCHKKGDINSWKVGGSGGRRKAFHHDVERRANINDENGFHHVMDQLGHSTNGDTGSGNKEAGVSS
uniref:Uncharacterized protein n=1 Tax=Nelumbo nucifera TaxID=4432 RepID=A0A822YBB2_NELNU|nr:TPA_asm: hypothetical protein HUJ06_029783 [Nelumbo nucifera]